MITCANKICNNLFTKRTVSMKYCGEACRKEATNENLKAKYYLKKARKEGKLTRICTVCEITTLSRYNKEDTCSPCQEQVKADARNKLLKELLEWV